MNRRRLRSTLAWWIRGWARALNRSADRLDPISLVDVSKIGKQPAPPTFSPEIAAILAVHKARRPHGDRR